MKRVVIFIACLLFISGCSTRGVTSYKTQSHTSSSSEGSYQTSSSMDPKTHTHPTMRPYEIRGKRYYPTVVSVGDIFEGIASWYGPDFHGKLTSNGETYNMHEMTAAHKTLPMNTIVRVTSRVNDQSVVVRINDRGPFVGDRIIDLSKEAAKRINMIGAGTAPVKLEVLGFKTKKGHALPTQKELDESPKQQESGNFALQIGSFSRIEGAIITQEKYNNIDGYKSIIKDFSTASSSLYKVWLTGFKSEQEARDYKELDKVPSSFIVKED